MTSPYDAALTAVATRTLARLCGLSAIAHLDDVQREASADAAMSVRFRGPISGQLVVRCAGGILPQLARNMLGDAEGSPTMQRDALGELANVLCSHLLPVIGGSWDAYLVGAPQPTVVLRHSSVCPVATVLLGIEHGGRADLLLFLDGLSNDRTTLAGGYA